MQNKSEKSIENLKKRIIVESDTCVRCGLCLPHCPTYQAAEVETESPRGRIAMVKALAEANVSLTPGLKQHLENCLGCMACEAMCPAKVPYHDLMIDTRELLYLDQTKPIPTLLSLLLKNLRLTTLLQRIYNLYQKTGLAWILKKTKLSEFFGIETYTKFMPDQLAIANFKVLYPAKENLGDVGLFIGCINRLCDATTIFKAIEILNGLGFNVHIPKNQVCCGAIHLHNGAPEQAEKYMHENSKAFSNLKLTAIITVATGCHSSVNQLKDIADTFKSIPVFDINDFILQHDNHKIALQKNLSCVLIHTPCTLKNTMKQPKLLENLLRKLGVTQFKHLKSYGCCGAAGLTMWNSPDLAQELAAPIIQQIIEEKPDFVITANIGCQLHLQRNLKELGLKTRVLHPLNLLFAEN